MRDPVKCSIFVRGVKPPWKVTCVNTEETVMESHMRERVPLSCLMKEVGGGGGVCRNTRMMHTHRVMMLWSTCRCSCCCRHVFVAVVVVVAIVCRRFQLCCCRRGRRVWSLSLCRGSCHCRHRSLKHRLRNVVASQWPRAERSSIERRVGQCTLACWFLRNMYMYMYMFKIQRLLGEPQGQVLTLRVFSLMEPTSVCTFKTPTCFTRRRF